MSCGSGVATPRSIGSSTWQTNGAPSSASRVSSSTPFRPAPRSITRLRIDAAGVDPGRHADHAHADHRLAMEHRPVDRRGPAIFRQQRAVQIDRALAAAAPAFRRKDLPVVRDDIQIRLEGGQRRARVGRVDIGRIENRQAAPFGFDADSGSARRPVCRARSAVAASPVPPPDAACRTARETWARQTDRSQTSQDACAHPQFRLAVSSICARQFLRPQRFQLGPAGRDPFVVRNLATLATIAEFDLEIFERFSRAPPCPSG